MHNPSSSFSSVQMHFQSLVCVLDRIGNHMSGQTLGDHVHIYSTIIKIEFDFEKIILECVE